MQRDKIDFENGNVAKLFRQMLIPTLLGTLSMSAMTAIDGIIVGHGVGPYGVAAVNIVVPIYQIMSGLGLMLGIGCSVVASIHLAQHKPKVARLNITQSLCFATIVASMICLWMLLFPHLTAKTLGSSPELMDDVVDYMLWLIPGFIFEMFSMIGLFVIRLDGAPRYAMWCNIIPAVLNAILDYVFIFPFGMGVKGAAIATSMCMVLGGIMALYYILSRAQTLRIEMPKFSHKSLRLSLRNIGYQCRIGVSSLMGELSLAILIYMGNVIFMRYLGNDGVGAFGIACYYTPFFFMVGNAIAQSAQPIISYNYGIQRWKNVAHVRRLLLYTSFVCGAAVALMFLFAPTLLVGLFIDSASPAAKIAIEGFPIYATGIVFFILNVAIIGYYQSIERIQRATLFVVLRGLIFLIPAFMLLPAMFGGKAIWFAMPATEAATLLVIVTLLLFDRRRGANRS